MTYALPGDIRETVAPDGNFGGTCAELTDDQLSQHLQRAQALVDGTTGQAFDDTNAPVLLKGLVVALGAYYATLAYRKGKDLTPQDPMYLLYQDAEATLTEIRNDQITFEPIPQPDTAGTGTATPALPKVTNPLLYGVTAFTGEDFGLGVRQAGGRDGPRVAIEDAPRNEYW